MSLRYRSEGEVHKDFHRLTCATLHYLADNYGIEAVQRIVRDMAINVYRAMHEALKAGDCRELCEYWEYYLKREGGRFSVDQMSDGVRLTVHECPAQRQLQALGEVPDGIMCMATRIFNDALSEDSPYRAETTRTGDFSCVQEFRKREPR